jgi:hypothetical protein
MDKDSTPAINRRFFVGLAAAVVVVWLLWAVYGVRLLRLALPLPDEGVAVLGQVGDIFGGINALFAAFAFVGVAAAAYMQHQTLQLANAQHAIDSFEPLFFKLIDRVRPPEAIAQIAETLRRTSTQTRMHPSTSNQETLLSQLKQDYAIWYEADESKLGPYYRSLYHVYKLIWLSPLDETRKVQYANIARASMSSDEILVMAANCLSEHGRNFRPLVRYFGLLKHRRTSTAEIAPVIGETELRTADEMLVDLVGPEACMSHRQRLDYWAEGPARLVELTRELKAAMRQ